VSVIESVFVVCDIYMEHNKIIDIEIPATISKRTFNCNYCNSSFISLSSYKTHCETTKHKNYVKASQFDMKQGGQRIDEQRIEEQRPDSTNEELTKKYDDILMKLTKTTEELNIMSKKYDEILTKTTELTSIVEASENTIKQQQQQIIDNEKIRADAREENMKNTVSIESYDEILKKTTDLTTTIEDRDNRIQEQEKTIQEQVKTIQDRDNRIQERDNRIQEQEKTIQEQEKTIQEQVKTIQDRDNRIQEQDKIIQEEKIRADAREENRKNTVSKKIYDDIHQKTSELTSTIEERDNRIEELSRVIEDRDDTIQEQVKTIEEYDNEAIQEYDYENTIRDQKSKINERDNTIQELTSVIEVNEKKIEDLELIVDKGGYSKRIAYKHRDKGDHYTSKTRRKKK